ncbi:MAG TPA: hypothetical protein VEC36_08705 [Patescibacteria group bacterium]|nr:hypothetical protein [Patescibacteria group bacterium]
MPVIFIATLTSCTENNITEPEQIVFPATNVSYTAHVEPFLHISCTFSGCHASDAGTYGSFSMNTFFDLYSRPGLIKPYDPDNSTLNMIMERRLPHYQQMRAGITENHAKGLRQWVLEGGKNN